MDTLPLELTQHILHQIPGNLNPPELSTTLRACSLVSHNFKAHAQPLLFSEFIRYGHYYRLPKLYETLLLYPYLLDLLKGLWVDVRCLSDGQSDESDLDTLLDLWISSSTSRNYYLTVDCALEPMTPKTLTTLSRFISSTNLTVLAFSEVIEAPIWILYHCISVRELHLCRSSFSGFDSDGVGGLMLRGNGIQSTWYRMTLDRPRLYHLYLESADTGDTPILKWFLHSDCAFDITALRTFHFLDISNDFDSYTLARNLVRRVSCSLEDLALDPPTRFCEQNIYLSPEFCTFDTLPRLRRLKFSLQQEKYPRSSLLPWVVNVLSGLAFPEFLEEVEVSCFLGDCEAEDVRRDGGWEELDLFLASTIRPGVGEQPTGHLKKVRFGIVVRVQSEEKEKTRSREVAAILPVVLPKLWALGIAMVSFSSVFGHVKDADCWYEPS